jgi:hypothetical protein
MSDTEKLTVKFKTHVGDENRASDPVRVTLKTGPDNNARFTIKK